jgi:uncharacterized membrane protein
VPDPAVHGALDADVTVRPSGRRRTRDLSRLEGFSDAVFAFAATLLVVSLEVPAGFDELLADVSGFSAFSVSFAALILIWTVHNAYFRRYGLQDGWTVFLNAALLFVVLFYVFPLKFLAASFTVHVLGVGPPTAAPALAGFEELGVIFLLYSVGFMLIFLCVSLMYRHAASRAEPLGLDAWERWEARMLERHYLIFAGVALVSIVTAFAGIGVRFGVPGLLYLALGPLCWWHGRWSERSAPSPAPEGAPEM